MTNEEKLYQIFPDGVCPFSKVWLSEEYREPTTKNNLGVDLISRKQAIEEADKLCLETGYDNEKVIEMLEDLPSVTPQESTIKALGEELRKARKGITDEKVLIGYNMAVAICNKHLGETEVDNGNDDN